MNKALAMLVVCVLAAGLPGCTSPSNPDRSKDFPLAVLNSVFVPGILLSSGVDQSTGGNAYLALKIRMENKGSSTASTASSGFKVTIDAESYPCQFLKDTGTDPRFDGQDFGTAVIPSKSYIEGWAVFEVPLSVRSVNTGVLRFADKNLLGDGAYSRCSFFPSSAKRYENVSERFSVEVRSMTTTYKYSEDGKAVLVPSPDNLFAVGDLVITNNARTKVHLYITSDSIVFVSSQKTEYVRGTFNTAPDPASPLKSQDIQPGASAKGTVIYEVTAEDSYINKVMLKHSATETYSYAIPKARIDIESDNAPTARISANDTGFIDTDMQFDANASTDPDGDALAYLWDFGEAGSGSRTSTEAQATHKYADPGSYTVSLRVKDIGGLENAAAKTIKITHYFSLKEKGHGLENSTGSLYMGDYYVDVNLSNRQNRTRPVQYSLFKLKTSDGAYIEWDGDNGAHPASLAGGASALWRVYFQLPAGKIPISIIYDDTVTAAF
jgi:hypothetical protein